MNSPFVRWLLDLSVHPDGPEPGASVARQALADELRGAWRVASVEHAPREVIVADLDDPAGDAGSEPVRCEWTVKLGLEGATPAAGTDRVTDLELRVGLEGPQSAVLDYGAVAQPCEQPDGSLRPDFS